MSSVFVSADCSAGYVANIRMEEESFVIDESGIEEGVKTGPDPNDYLMSALGACTVITLHMYAKRKNWPLDRAEVLLRMEPLDSGTLPEPEAFAGKRLLVVKRLRLFGDLSPEQHKRLEDISSRCPVQKTLEAGVAVHTILEVQV
ncbi:OsmC family protein [Pontibacter roseus]|uniref:OsmC family protein n=1 Tax=Pontibacter roseus TaxID=336989 RepID=UPI0003625938|nr:OsmC family protein [Pontibacter roseus]